MVCIRTTLLQEGFLASYERFLKFGDPFVGFCWGLYVKDLQYSEFALGFLMPLRPNSQPNPR